MVLTWRAEEAADRLRDPAVLDVLLEEPLLVLDLRDGDGPGPASLARVPCPVVALTQGPTQWPVDLALTEGSPDVALLGDDAEAAADRLAEAAGRAPAAAAVLAQVLRTTPALPVEQALTVESLAYSLLLTGPEFRQWHESRRLPRASTQSDPEVLVRRDGPLLELVLNRPQVRNAYDAAMRDQLVEALALAVLDESVQRVLLRGNGSAFCSGGDLRDFGTSADLVRAHGIRGVRHPGALLHALAPKTEVHVHGVCVGAGVELPAFAGRVVASADTRFLLPELAMGTIPGAGGTVSLPRRIGSGRTLLLALSGIELGAEDALRWGLVDEVERDVPAS